MPQAKADRSAAAKKAAATRQRNQQRLQSQEAGRKSAITRQKRDAQESAHEAKKAAKGALRGVEASARFAGNAVVQAGKAAASSLGAGKKKAEK
jgi:hypothetical protein